VIFVLHFVCPVGGCTGLSRACPIWWWMADSLKPPGPQSKARLQTLPPQFRDKREKIAGENLRQKQQGRLADITNQAGNEEELCCYYLQLKINYWQNGKKGLGWAGKGNVMIMEWSSLRRIFEVVLLWLRSEWNPRKLWTVLQRWKKSLPFLIFVGGSTQAWGERGRYAAKGMTSRKSSQP